VCKETGEHQIMLYPPQATLGLHTVTNPFAQGIGSLRVNNANELMSVNLTANNTTAVHAR